MMCLVFKQFCSSISVRMSTYKKCNIYFKYVSPSCKYSSKIDNEDFDYFGVNSKDISRAPIPKETRSVVKNNIEDIEHSNDQFDFAVKLKSKPSDTVKTSYDSFRYDKKYNVCRSTDNGEYFGRNKTDQSMKDLNRVAGYEDYSEALKENSLSDTPHHRGKLNQSIKSSKHSQSKISSSFLDELYFGRTVDDEKETMDEIANNNNLSSNESLSYIDCQYFETGKISHYEHNGDPILKDNTDIKQTYTGEPLVNKNIFEVNQNSYSTQIDDKMTKYRQHDVQEPSLDNYVNENIYPVDSEHSYQDKSLVCKKISKQKQNSTLNIHNLDFGETFSNIDRKADKVRNINKDNLVKRHQKESFIDDQYFSYTSDNHNQNTIKIPRKDTIFNVNNENRHSSNQDNRSSLAKEYIESTNDERTQNTAWDIRSNILKEMQNKSSSNIRGKMNPKEYDSQGFRILTKQVPNFEHVTSYDIANILKQNIIYDKNDVIAINKPYGLPSHGGPGVKTSVGQLLDKIISNNDLYLVHRLDKETTGVMLLAKTKEMADKLHDFFVRKEVVKRYLAITKNIPQMHSGEIDIPIVEGSVEEKYRMALRPYLTSELRQVAKHRQTGSEAITRYTVLDTSEKCALLECIPATGVKHQIRVHLAFGLNCPVLGDHKYSHIDKLAPMRLHPEMLKLLNIRQSKVRHVAMHLHARSILIPNFLDGRNLFISATLPNHFIKNMKDLKLKLPPHA